MKKFFGNIKVKFLKFKKSFSDNFDFGDFLSLIGLSMVFYGFYIWKPMFAFIIVGFILFYVSASINRIKK